MGVYIFLRQQQNILSDIIWGCSITTPYFKDASAETSLTTPSRDGITQKKKRKTKFTFILVNICLRIICTTYVYLRIHTDM